MADLPTNQTAGFDTWIELFEEQSNTDGNTKKLKLRIFGINNELGR